MVLLDSDIIIFASKKEDHFLRNFIFESAAVVSVISRIEVLGFPAITPVERSFLDRFFDTIIAIDLTSEIVERAIWLRTMRRIKLADSVIAATALFNNLTLVTNNEKDFSWIEGLTIINPLTK